MKNQTIYQILKCQAEQNPEALAIVAPDRPPLTYRALYRQVELAAGWLHRLKLGRNERVAMVLPNGPEMAGAFLAVAASATSAPLNPAYRAAEFDFYLSDLDAKALLISAELGDSPARQVAQARGIPVINLEPEVEAAGCFRLTGHDHTPIESQEGGQWAQPEDIALVLHTSGTTSRPKIVPLTQLNLSTSAHNIKTTLALTPEDCCLNVMPLFHIHGLMAAVLSSVAAGARVVCTPGFQSDKFFEWLTTFQPTWYTAVPTIHQAVLNRVEASPELAAGASLRFIRSSSSALPPPVMAGLERAFKTPVIEAYGMTEAAHQMASNPLPPQARKPGTVGLAAGPEIAIMDELGTLLPAGSQGEIVIRGANVTLGYENNPAANQSAFSHGWFRTGDQGVMDEAGYLSIIGRLKEMINRGGEKIAPREVDELFLEHPAVSQAVAFAIPHPTLGEDLAVAVVLHSPASSLEGASRVSSLALAEGGSQATEQELRRFAFSRLAAYKVPSRVVLVAEIPKGPTGKLQRLGLAEKLAPQLKVDYTPPRTELEAALAQLWAETLGLAQVGIHDNFFTLGGDSLSAARVLNQLSGLTHKPWPLPLLFQAPTIEQLAEIIHREGESESPSSLVVLQPLGSNRPFFCLPGNLGNVFTDLSDLARYLDPEQPFYALQDGLHTPLQIATKATYYLEEIRQVQPQGPYLLGGICQGGLVAYEMAQQLLNQGQEVAFLAIIEPQRLQKATPGAYARFAVETTLQALRRLRHQKRQLAQVKAAEQGAYLRLKARVVANRWASVRYTPAPYPGQLHLFLSQDSLQQADNPQLNWLKLATGSAELHQLPGNHDTITGNNDTKIDPAHMQALAEHLNHCLRQVGSL